MQISLETLAGRFAVCRLPPEVAVPDWAGLPSGLSCITRTEDELSVITDERHVPGEVQAERGFVALRIVGELAFSEVGILATLTGALARADIPVLAVSTYRTDVLLVREAHAQRACEALQGVADVALRPC